MPASALCATALHRSLLLRPPARAQALLSQGKRPKVELSKAVKALGAAGDDLRVKGLLAFIGPMGGAGLAQVQELRQAVLAFRCAWNCGVRVGRGGWVCPLQLGGAGGWQAVLAFMWVPCLRLRAGQAGWVCPFAAGRGGAAAGGASIQMGV